MPDERPHEQRGKHGQRARQHDGSINAELACTVDDSRLVQFFGRTFEKGTHQDHVVHIVGARDDIHPKGVQQPDGAAEQIIRDHAARKEHREQIQEIERLSEMQFLAAHAVSDERREQYAEDGTRKDAQDRDQQPLPDALIRHDRAIIGEREHARPEDDAAALVIGTVVQRADDRIPDREKGDKGEYDQKRDDDIIADGVFPHLVQALFLRLRRGGLPLQFFFHQKITPSPLIFFVTQLDAQMRMMPITDWNSPMAVAYEYCMLLMPYLRT